jgi:hypothetical protein
MSAAHVIGRVVGATLVVCGAHFLVRALTGKTPLEHLEAWLRSADVPEREQALVVRRDWSLPLPPSDPIDESSWESFPASDPPAHSRKNA